MTTAKVETLTWVTIYAGMALIGLGLSLRRTDAGLALGFGTALVGATGVVVGAVLVWMRSRMKAGDGA